MQLVGSALYAKLSWWFNCEGRTSTDKTKPDAFSIKLGFNAANQLIAPRHIHSQTPNNRRQEIHMSQNRVQAITICVASPVMKERVVASIHTSHFGGSIAAQPRPSIPLHHG
jgi:hypothetical protein